MNDVYKILIWLRIISARAGCAAASMNPPCLGNLYNGRDVRLFVTDMWWQSISILALRFFHIVAVLLRLFFFFLFLNLFIFTIHCSLFFFFLSMSKEILPLSLFSYMFIYTVSIIQLILLVIMLLWWWWLFFGEETQKKEVGGERKMEFELFRALRHLSLRRERDGDVINGIGYHHRKWETQSGTRKREAVCGKHARETHTDT